MKTEGWVIMQHELKVVHRGMDNQWYCTCGKWHMLIREGYLNEDAVDAFIEHIDKATPVKT